MNDPDQYWQKLVKAARRAPSEPAERRPPPGFVSRIIDLRQTVVSFVRTLAWRRWSVLVALFSALVFLAVLAVTRCSAPQGPLIAPPELIPIQP